MLPSIPNTFNIPISGVSLASDGGLSLQGAPMAGSRGVVSAPHPAIAIDTSRVPVNQVQGSRYAVAEYDQLAREVRGIPSTRGGGRGRGRGRGGGRSTVTALPPQRSSARIASSSSGTTGAADSGDDAGAVDDPEDEDYLGEESTGGGSSGKTRPKSLAIVQPSAAPSAKRPTINPQLGAAATTTERGAAAASAMSAPPSLSVVELLEELKVYQSGSGTPRLSLPDLVSALKPHGISVDPATIPARAPIAGAPGVGSAGISASTSAGERARNGTVIDIAAAAPMGMVIPPPYGASFPSSAGMARATAAARPQSKAPRGRATPAAAAGSAPAMGGAGAASTALSSGMLRAESVTSAADSKRTLAEERKLVEEVLAAARRVYEESALKWKDAGGTVSGRAPGGGSSSSSSSSSNSKGGRPEKISTVEFINVYASIRYLQKHIGTTGDELKPEELFLPEEEPHRGQVLELLREKMTEMSVECKNKQKDNMKLEARVLQFLSAYYERHDEPLLIVWEKETPLFPTAAQLATKYQNLASNFAEHSGQPMQTGGGTAQPSPWDEATKRAFEMVFEIHGSKVAQHMNSQSFDQAEAREAAKAARASTTHAITASVVADASGARRSAAKAPQLLQLGGLDTAHL